MIDKSHPGVWIYPSGREVLQHNAAGRKIMQDRRDIARHESKGICCLCEQPVHPNDATLEHFTSKGSGGGTHDDRQSNLGISHLAGNVAKGSMSLGHYLEIPLETRIRNCQGY
jgi:hypothetical protein